MARRRRKGAGHEINDRVVGRGMSPPEFSAPPRPRAAVRLPVRHHIPSRNQGSGAIDLDGHAALADMDAHGAMQPVGKHGGRIGDMPPMRLDRAPRLAPKRRERPPAFRSRGQKLLREVGMQAYGKRPVKRALA